MAHMQLPIDRMTLISVYERLSNIDDNIWIDAVKSAREIRESANTILLRSGADLRQFMLLLAGTVRVYKLASDGREITLYRVKPGDLCILSLNSLFRNRDYNAIAEAETDIYALGISDHDFKIALKQSDAFRDFVLSALNERLCDLMCLVEDTAFENLSARMLSLIKSIAKDRNSCRIHVTHQHLARELGTTREVISRILKEFEKRHVLSLHRGYIEVFNHD